eukprot:TRINITY_DN28578_c0_g1_i1.p4 TRINITY_DN28578_c0_g1~~TRINITY_DN28578_c0_g1_i1.p4  ORF type:complete len:120 (+),score=1.07 TRINITY_DN28578_c0_g1_i1:209-568(+)
MQLIYKMWHMYIMYGQYYIVNIYNTYNRIQQTDSSKKYAHYTGKPIQQKTKCQNDVQYVYHALNANNTNVQTYVQQKYKWPKQQLKYYLFIDHQSEATAGGAKQIPPKKHINLGFFSKF